MRNVEHFSYLLVGLDTVDLDIVGSSDIVDLGTAVREIVDLENRMGSFVEGSSVVGMAVEGIVVAGKVVVGNFAAEKVVGGNFVVGNGFVVDNYGLGAGGGDGGYDDDVDVHTYCSSDCNWGCRSLESNCSGLLQGMY